MTSNLADNIADAMYYEKWTTEVIKGSRIIYRNVKSKENIGEKLSILDKIALDFCLNILNFVEKKHASTK